MNIPFCAPFGEGAACSAVGDFGRTISTFRRLFPTFELAKMSLEVGFLAVVFASASVAGAQGASVYKDPGGVFSVNVPAGWETQAQPGSPMISIVNAKTKVSVTLGVMRGPEANTPSAESELQTLEKQLPQNCPQAKIQERGAAKLAGLPGSFLVVHCNGQDGPQLMKMTTASRPGIVAIMVTNSPGESFMKVLMPLESIHNSLRILPAGQAGTGGQRSGAAMGAADGQQSGGAVEGNAAMQGGGRSGTYQDPQGRYSLSVPSGWNSASDNGNLTLSSGASWVTVATGTGGQPSEENHQIVQQIQAQYKDFKILNEGDFQNGGHPSHGTNATGINPKGQRVSVLVVSISAGGGHYLVLISSAPNDQAQQINGTVMQMAQSVKFGGN